MKAKRCEVRYHGSTVPSAHGTRCVKDEGHEGERHYAYFLDMPLAWWTPEEKKEIRARRGKGHG